MMQAQTAMAASAAAVLISNTQEGGFLRLVADANYSGPPIRVGVASMPRTTAGPLYAALAAGMALSVQFLNASISLGTPRRLTR